MLVLSRYVHNRAYPVGSMIEGYSTEEVVECCQEYLKVHKGIGPTTTTTSTTTTAPTTTSTTVLLLLISAFCL